MTTMTSMPNSVYATCTDPSTMAPSQAALNASFIHTLFPTANMSYARPLYPIYQTADTSATPGYLPHNPIAAAAAAAAAANATFARVQHRPFHEVKRRRRLTPDETRRLTYVFTQHTTKPDATLRQQLADELGMTARAVQVWFQNRRAKVKREQEAVGKEEEPTTTTAADSSLQEMMNVMPTSHDMVHEYMQQDAGAMERHHSQQQQQQQQIEQAQQPIMVKHEDAAIEEELQAIESLLNLDSMIDGDQDMSDGNEDSLCSEHDSLLNLGLAVDMLKRDLTTKQQEMHGRNVHQLSVCTGMRDNPVLADTTLTTGIADGDELRRNGFGGSSMRELTSPDTVSYGSDVYDEAFALYNSMSSSSLLQQQQQQQQQQQDKSAHSSPLSNTMSTISDEPSLASMAELMSNALSDLVIPFPGSPFTPGLQGSFSASPCSLPLTPAQEMEMLEMLQLPTPMAPSTPARKSSVNRAIAPRCNSFNNHLYAYSPLVSSPMSKSAQQRQECRKSRSVATSPYHFGTNAPSSSSAASSSSKEFVWMTNLTPREIEQKPEVPLLHDVRRIQQQHSGARRYSWSVGSQ